MYCPKCGRSIQNNIKFCPDCGAALPVQSNPQPAQQGPVQSYSQPSSTNAFAPTPVTAPSVAVKAAGNKTAKLIIMISACVASAVLILVLAVVMISGNKSPAKAIIGSWSFTDTRYNITVGMDFYPDGTLVMKYENDSYEGTYSVNDANTLILNGRDEYGLSTYLSYDYVPLDQATEGEDWWYVDGDKLYMGYTTEYLSRQ